MRTFYTTVGALAIALTTSIGLPACSHEPKDSKEAAEEMNDNKFSKDDEKDAECLVNAYSSNLFEIKVSENASLNAIDPNVKQLANTLLEKHMKMNADVKALADKKQISLPNDLTDAQRDKISKLTEKSGLDYDKDYVQMMKDKHVDAIKTYEKDVDNCVDNDIKLWASQTVGEVRAHLDMIENTWNQIKDRK